MYNGKVIIGVAGTIGSGKTTVCKMFASMGACYISADEIGRRILPDIAQALQEYFGDEIMKGTTINREKLADRVFTRPEDLQYLNSISHPLLVQRLKERINKATASPVVIDAALLFDWPDIMDIVDYPILVTAFEEVKKARCIARSMDRRRYSSIRANQKNDAMLSPYARFIINNNGTVEDLRDRCRSILKEIKDGHRV